MRARWMVCAGAVLGVALGCGDSNLLSGLADENSTQAKLEKAQVALDTGDCQTALTLFGELQAADATNVARRLDLSAAHLCAAGFDAQAFIAVAAAFGTSTVSSTTVFEEIADQAVDAINASWPTELAAAETLLAANLSLTPPTAYNGDPDAAFNLAVVEAVKAVLTISDILNYVNGVVECAATQGSSAFTDCRITVANVASIVDALEDANGVLLNLGVTSEIRDTINRVLTDLNAVSGTATDTVTCADLQTYLTSQGFNLTGVTCGP